MSARYRSRISLAICISLLSLAGCEPQVNSTVTSPKASTAVDEKPSIAAEVNDNKPKVETDQTAKLVLTQVDFDGFASQIKNLAGKYVLIDVWSTSCLPCMREYPNLVKLSQRWPDKLACVSLNVDYTGIKSKPPESYVPKITTFLEKQQSYSVVNLISSLPDTEIYDKLAITSIPSILLYDADGKLVKQFAEVNAAGEAMTYEKDIIPELESLIK